MKTLLEKVVVRVELLNERDASIWEELEARCENNVHERDEGEGGGEGEGDVGGCGDGFAIVDERAQRGQEVAALGPDECGERLIRTA